MTRLTQLSCQKIQVVGFTDGSNRILGPESSIETQVGVETRKFASIDVTGFAENVYFIRVERSFGTDSCYTSGPEKQSTVLNDYQPCRFHK